MPGAENATATDNSTATASAEAKAPRKGKGSKGPPYPRLPAEERTSARRWTLQELALHDGESRERPLLLAILGEVYDVGPGERFYGPGEGYHVFAGKDASRAFTTGQFNDGAVPGLKGLLPEQISDVISWRSFYQKSDKYRFVGYLVGDYYDEEAQPLRALLELEALQSQTDANQKVIADLRSRFKACNTKSSQDEPHSEIWCDDSYHGQGTRPVFVRAKITELGKEDSWCACLTPEAKAAAREDPKSGSTIIRLSEYPECAGDKQRCFRPKAAGPPP
ncbi:unnamed protein product [Effrenium voratum]|uniref:Cytochrome b5 heme-binding domain-containing protein n=1 Tax=Effrenium voratum TaxID=2562239 RepID=A0AA36IV75_9DINO|nr:unnamed protein product [Effrenium voratum]